MKNLGLTALILTLSLGSAATASTMRGAMMQPALDFAALDTDGDGRISLEEWQAHIAARAALSPEERRALGAETWAQTMISTHDQDGDGALNADELAAAITALRGEPRAGQEPRRGYRGERHAARGEDRPRAGMRDRDSRAADPARIAQRGERMFGWIDADSDGFITPEELDAARERMASREDRPRWRR